MRFPRFHSLSLISLSFALVFVTAAPVVLRGAEPVAKPAFKPDFFSVYMSAMAARRMGNFDQYIGLLEAANRMDPGRPAVINELAAAQAQAGKIESALGLLSTLAKMGLYLPIQNDADFSSIKSNPEYQSILEAFRRNLKSVGSSVPAYVISEKDLIPEGMAFDPATKRVFVGSLYKKKVIVVEPDGRVHDFVREGQDGLWGVLGLRVDSAHNALWVCSAAGPESPSSQAGRSGLFKFRLSDGKLMQKFLLEDPKKNHFLNDVVVGANGDAYVTDTLGKAIFRVTPGSKKMTPFVTLSDAQFANGIAISDDQSKLYVAHGGGITVVDLKTRKWRALAHPADVTLDGIDGLYFFRGSLIAVQNGVDPQRVIRYFLKPSLDTVSHARVLAANNPIFDIPTTGAIADGCFYFLANSQLNALRSDGSILSSSQLKDVNILKIPL